MAAFWASPQTSGAHRPKLHASSTTTSCPFIVTVAKNTRLSGDRFHGCKHTHTMGATLLHAIVIGEEYMLVEVVPKG